jgi:hypothetical protein
VASLFKEKMQKKNIKTKHRRSKFMEKYNDAQTNKVQRCVNREFDISSGVMGHPQAYGVDHYLNDSLFDSHSFHMKKLRHKTLSHLFYEWMTLVGTKDNMHASIKPPNKIWYMMYR